MYFSAEMARTPNPITFSSNSEFLVCITLLPYLNTAAYRIEITKQM
jgi:hypothetical protein